ncbi:MAG: 16S rRNA (uracil(1498)-N(3))-methyltransferase [Opitutaceae bacterium]|jgi:16S rRNA (uracil1498-N3)-methyltransferase|nr:16S rRNA (uracil(1498)-N(3))-methyltransferase [Opitutaceae bacterium]
MADFRVHVGDAAADAPELALSREESHHLVAVNRARAGAPVTAFDGRGREWLCELARADKNAARLRVLSSRAAAGVRLRITLAQAVPLGGAMDGIVRRATELGAARVIPLETERTQARFATGGGGERKVGKWRVAALEAAKQCGNAWLPEVGEARTLGDFLREERGGLKLVASLHAGSLPLKKALSDFRARQGGRAPEDATWLVGPEGDFSPAEMRAAADAGFVPVTLGPLVLRCETAATCAIALLLHEAG